jgi:hypothetical protein
MARGDEQMNHRHATGAISFSVRLVTVNGTTLGADTLTELRWRPLRAAGRATITNRLTC